MVSVEIINHGSIGGNVVDKSHGLEERRNFKELFTESGGRVHFSGLTYHLTQVD